MDIILVKKKGDARTVRVGWRAALAAVFLALGLTVALSTTSYAVFFGHYLVPGMIDQWRDRLAEQDARVRELEQQTLAESGAVGRQLAQMQSRLWRVESLGIQVAEVASIPLDEFGFDLPAPIGGPVAGCETALDRPNLRAGLEALAIDIRNREEELEALEKLLDNQKYREAVRFSGWPVRQGWISSPYGRRVDPISGKIGWHAGMDFAGRQGADVMAIADGVVVYSGNRKNYGKIVEIDHGDGYVTRYAHNDELRVKVGDIVKRGDTVGALGTTGRTTGPHVHIEVIKNGRHVDPAKYVARRNS